MRVALLIDNLTGGGAEAVILRLAEAIAAQGVDTHLIIFEDIIAYQVPSEVTLHLVIPKKGSKLPKPLRQLQLSRMLRHKIDSIGPFDLHIASLPWTHRVVMKANLPNLIYCIHSSYYTVYLKPKSGFDRFLRKRKLVNRYSGEVVSYVSEGARQELEEQVGATPRVSRVIYNPFPITQLQQQASENISLRGPYFLHVGRFHPLKRHDLLLKMYKASGVQQPLVLLGDGSEEQRQQVRLWIKQFQLEEQVILLGFKPNPLPYMKNATALLLCSDHEGLPTVVVEALITETPVISFDCPSGPREILTGELAEYLIPQGDEQDFVGKMRELDVSPRRISHQTSQISRFSSENIAQQYLKLIEEFK